MRRDGSYFRRAGAIATHRYCRRTTGGELRGGRWRGTRAALRTQDNFGRFLAVGITSMIVLQAFINISVVLGLMPTKGIPLPFVSYGGSSLFVTLMCVGVLLNITKQAE